MVACGESVSDASLTGFVADYTTKDLILYALAVGFGSGEKEKHAELRYLYEGHVGGFSAVPSFPLVLPFWADRPTGTSANIKTFPPPMMKNMGVLPRKFLRAEHKPADNLPVIHTSQSITWHRPVPTPKQRTGGSVRTKLSSRILSVAPKSIGTFITSETRITSSESLIICTLQSTNLVLGMPSDDVIAFGKTSRRKRQRQSVFKQTLVFEWTYKTLPSQALLYRMASSDTNAIHVEHSERAASLVGTSKRPLLHGLCTLGIAVRGIMTFLRESDGVEYEFNLLEADFTKPGSVGDSLMVRLWESETVSPHKASTHQRKLSFKVLNSETGDTVVDSGLVQVTRTNLLQTQARL